MSLFERISEEARRISRWCLLSEIERDLGNEDASLSVSFPEKLVKSQEKNYLIQMRLNSLN